MLTMPTREVIAATLPAVDGALAEITPNFYARMFAAHPTLLDDMFNRTHQRSGEQPMALAGSIAAFAKLQLEPDLRRQRFIIDRIAHKHASLGVTRDQYSIVHEHLFAAIVEVLGAAVTPEVANAWDELYWEMADVLIREEADLYAAAGVEPGAVWRDLVVTRRDQVAPDAVSFTLAASDGADLPVFSPGQYISVQVPLADGAHQIRQYSLIGTPQARDEWRISVKLAGEVSAYLHENVFEGDVVHVSMPFGDLVLPEDDSPLLLASAGIGCTPVIGLLTALAESGTDRPVTVLHADHSRAGQPHRGQLGALVEQIDSARLYQWYQHGADHLVSDAVRSGRMSLDGIDLADGVHAMLCGPTGFLDSIRTQLLDRNVPSEHIHFETFGPELLRTGASR
ncbi:putative FAD-binding oxidoreductase [Gordonia polyisoprenivorans VH2]|uniref:nitric oxide dioxygenase n=1 Tax=Gordonia polyisoprenivorans (strain DSM 44266 / VH2) TaxID=1112204 RepID=H6MZM8_GORPV|nr:FAD-binding oxidoreductase [Gordonia polyisoprenivorans]AFA72015.1 putative FAD-binding oxidoreductase [Gordonia polyisoprenivorans VH2]